MYEHFCSSQIWQILNLVISAGKGGGCSSNLVYDFGLLLQGFIVISLKVNTCEGIICLNVIIIKTKKKKKKNMENGCMGVLKIKTQSRDILKMGYCDMIRYDMI